MAKKFITLESGAMISLGNICYLGAPTDKGCKIKTDDGCEVDVSMADYAAIKAGIARGSNSSMFSIAGLILLIGIGTSAYFMSEPKEENITISKIYNCVVMEQPEDSN